MNFSFHSGRDLQQAYQQISDKYSLLGNQLSQVPDHTHIGQSDEGMRRIVDTFMGEMEKLGNKLAAKGKSLEPAQQQSLEFIAKQFDDVSGVGRGAADLITADKRMDKIFSSFKFDQSGRG